MRHHDSFMLQDIIIDILADVISITIKAIGCNVPIAFFVKKKGE